MDVIDLSVVAREKKGSRFSRRLRAAGKIPAVLYGSNEEPVALAVESSALAALLKVGSRMVSLRLGKAKQPALIRELQHDVYGDDILHVDFSRVSLKEKLDIDVTVLLTGTAKGVMQGGVLEQRRDSIEVRCLPTAIPKHIEVDVSGLDIGDAVHVGDVPLPEGVELADPSEDSREMVVASVTVVVEEEVEEVVEEAAGQPEVIGKGKEEEGEDKDKDKDKD